MDNYCKKQVAKAFSKWADEATETIAESDVGAVLRELPKGKKFSSWKPSEEDFLRKVAELQQHQQNEELGKVLIDRKGQTVFSLEQLNIILNAFFVERKSSSQSSDQLREKPTKLKSSLTCKKESTDSLFDEVDDLFSNIAQAKKELDDNQAQNEKIRAKAKRKVVHSMKEKVASKETHQNHLEIINKDELNGYRNRLINLYTKHEPSQLSKIDSLLERYSESEMKEFLRNLEIKYTMSDKDYSKEVEHPQKKGERKKEVCNKPSIDIDKGVNSADFNDSIIADAKESYIYNERFDHGTNKRCQEAIDCENLRKGIEEDEQILEITEQISKITDLYAEFDNEMEEETIATTDFPSLSNSDQNPKECENDSCVTFNNKNKENARNQKHDRQTLECTVSETVDDDEYGIHSDDTEFENDQNQESEINDGRCVSPIEYGIIPSKTFERVGFNATRPITLGESNVQVQHDVTDPNDSLDKGNISITADACNSQPVGYHVRDTRKSGDTEISATMSCSIQSCARYSNLYHAQSNELKKEREKVKILENMVVSARLKAQGHQKENERLKLCLKALQWELGRIRRAKNPKTNPL